MKIVFLTAGAAGMFCGSCMHDNALAKALIARGSDCLLQPVYTPIQTDDPSVASDRVFFGGVHIYLLQRIPGFARIPAPIRRLLDWSPLLKLATRGSGSTDAAVLGQLSVSMLQGEHGKQADEVNRLVDWLADEIRPDAIVLTNLLIGGALPTLRRRMPGIDVTVLLQGDDIFLDYLPQPEREAVTNLMTELVPHVDRFVSNSQFYADKMSVRLSIPVDRILVDPLSIDCTPFDPLPRQSRDGFRVGYLARIAPEKGLHRLIDAMRTIVDRHRDTSLHAAGWLGPQHRDYLSDLRRRWDANHPADTFIYHGSPTLEEKAKFLRDIDVLCVPTEYEEPKGLFVLEALACGVPVVQPDHGAFGELIDSTGGGLLYRAGDQRDLTDQLLKLKSDPDLARQLGETGRANVLRNHTIESAAERLLGHLG